MLPSLTLALALMACGSTPSTPAVDGEPSAQPAPAPAGPTADPMKDACKKVITSEDANKIFDVARSLKHDGTCVFEDVGAETSVVNLSFDTADGKKAPATLRPVECVKDRSKTSVAHGPWLLDIPEESKQACPKGYDALVGALVGGKFPAPSDAR